MAAGGLKVWNASNWKTTTIRVWDGSSWTPVTNGKVWNGSSWVPFYGNTWTSGSSQAVYVYGGGGYTRTDVDYYYGINTITSASNYYYPGLNPGDGAGSPGNNIGYAGNTVLGIFDWETSRAQNPGGTGNYDYYVGSWLVFSGNVTGTWWNSVTANGVTKNRTAATVATGTYNSGYDVTYWQWASSIFSFPISGTFTVSFT